MNFKKDDEIIILNRELYGTPYIGEKGIVVDILYKDTLIEVHFKYRKTSARLFFLPSSLILSSELTLLEKTIYEIL